MGAIGLDDITCYLFDKIIETNDTSLLGTKQHDKDWEDLMAEYIDLFGISKEYAMYLKKMRNYVVYLNNALQSGDKSLINIARAEKIQAEKSINVDLAGGVDKYAYVSKFMGFRVNPKEITVKEFYNYLKLAENGKEN